MSSGPGFFGILGRVYRYIPRSRRPRAWGLLGLMLIETLSDVVGLALVPPLVYIASDLTVVDRNPYLAKLKSLLGLTSVSQFVLGLVGFVLILFIARHIFGLWVLYKQHQFATGVSLVLARRKFNAVLSMPYEAFKRIPSSEATRDIAITPSEFGSQVLLPTSVILTEGFIVLWILLAIIVLDFKLLVMMTIIIGPPVLISRALVRGRAHKLGEERVVTRTEGYRVLSQALFGFPYLRLWRKGDFFVSKSLGAFAEYYRRDADLAVLSHAPRRLVELSAVLGIGLLIGYSVLSGKQDAAIVSLLAFVAAAAYRLMPSLTRILMSFTTLRSSVHIFNLLPEEPDALEAASLDGEEPRPLPFSSFAFENVSFQYAGADVPALRNATFRVEKGERIGFVGPSGSGKTTLMNIVLRFAREQTGVVLRDGVPLRPEDDRSWQKLLGYVQQDPYLLDGTLAENIAFGEEPDQIDREAVRQALKAASLEPLLQTLSAGIDTAVGEFGGTLSGGQRQRIAIARTLYRHSEILVLDEATSALDAETEWDVTKTLEDLSKDRGRTLLIIAHRGWMLSICDRIYRLEQGAIVEELSGEALSRWRESLERPPGH